MVHKLASFRQTASVASPSGVPGLFIIVTGISHDELLGSET
jgi:hypothetical protein